MPPFGGRPGNSEPDTPDHCVWFTKPGVRLPGADGPIRTARFKPRLWATNEFIDNAIEKHALDMMPGAFDKTARHHRQLPD